MNTRLIRFKYQLIDWLIDFDCQAPRRILVELRRRTYRNRSTSSVKLARMALTFIETRSVMIRWNYDWFFSWSNWHDNPFAVSFSASWWSMTETKGRCAPKQRIRSRFVRERWDTIQVRPIKLSLNALVDGILTWELMPGFEKTQQCIVFKNSQL